MLLLLFKNLFSYTLYPKHSFPTLHSSQNPCTNTFYPRSTHPLFPFREDQTLQDIKQTSYNKTRYIAYHTIGG